MRCWLTCFNLSPKIDGDCATPCAAAHPSQVDDAFTTEVVEEALALFGDANVLSTAWNTVGGEPIGAGGGWEGNRNCLLVDNPRKLKCQGLGYICTNAVRALWLCSVWFCRTDGGHNQFVQDTIRSMCRPPYAAQLAH